MIHRLLLPLRFTSSSIALDCRWAFLYFNLLTLLFLWLYFQGRRWLTTKFLLLLSPFILAHMVDGVTSVRIICGRSC